MTKIVLQDQNTAELIELDIPTPSDVGEVDISGITTISGTVHIPGGVDISSLVPTDSPIVGQVTVSGTGTAIPFSTESVELPGASVLVIAPSDNSESVVIGGSDVENTKDGTGNGLVIFAGKSVAIFADNLNKLYLNGAANDWVTYAAS